MSIALLLIDIQNDCFPGGAMKVAQATEAAVKASLLLAAFRKKSFPIIHIQHIAARPGATFFLPNTPGAEIHCSVWPLDGEPVFQKPFPSSFRQTPLLEHLLKENISQLLIAGMMTHMCIDTTVRAVADLGFSCLLAHDACAARYLSFAGREITAGDVHTAYCAALNGLFAEVLSTEDILSKLQI
jgi:nicotinamidase-related amidase